MKSRAEIQHDYYEKNKERLKEAQKRRYAEKHEEILAKKKQTYHNAHFGLFVIAKYTNEENYISTACRKHKRNLESRAKQLMKTGAFISYSIKKVTGSCMYCG